MATPTATVPTDIFTSKGRVTTLENLFDTLAAVVVSQENELTGVIDELGDSGAGLDQGKLLRVQGMVQSWSITAGLATGTIRAAGDAIVKVTQNIR